MTNAFMVSQSNPTPGPRSLPATGRTWLVRLLPTLATFALVALFAAAAVWQHARMQSKEALGARFAAAARIAPVALPQDVDDWTPWRYRNVTLAGRYDAPRQILIDTLWRQAVLVTVIALVAVVVVHRATRPVRELSQRLQARPEGDRDA